MSRLHWHPKTGEVKEFADSAETPPGWLDHHPADPAYLGTDEDDDGPGGNLSKREVIDALTEAGVQFNARDNLATLTELLDKTISDVFAQSELTAPEGASLRQRLDIVRRG